MSTAAHEPRRTGSRRAESPSGSKVTPRRNAPEASEPLGLQYDSDELPVLIRLPNLREIGSVEPPSTPRTRRKRHLIDRASAGQRSASQPEAAQPEAAQPEAAKAAKATKKPIPQQSSRDKKLVIGGLVGGVLVVVTLFLFNAGSPEPSTNQDGWASEAAALETPTQGVDITFATENVPPPLFDETLDAETAQYASGEFDAPELNVPIYTPPEPPHTETAASPNNQPPVNGWPSDEAMSLQSPTVQQPVDLWPGESMSREYECFGCQPTDSPSQTDYRSSMNTADSESFRMGKLNPDRPLATAGEQGSILDGNIEIPDTTRMR